MAFVGFPCTYTAPDSRRVTGSARAEPLSRYTSAVSSSHVVPRPCLENASASHSGLSDIYSCLLHHILAITFHYWTICGLLSSLGCRVYFLYCLVIAYRYDRTMFSAIPFAAHPLPAKHSIMPYVSPCSCSHLIALLSQGCHYSMLLQAAASSPTGLRGSALWQIGLPGSHLVRVRRRPRRSILLRRLLFSSTR